MTRFRRRSIPLLVTAAFAAPCAAWAQSDTDEKIRRLEDGIRQMQQELEDVKGQLQETRDKAVQTEQKIEQQGVQARFSEGVIFEDPRGNWAVRVSGRAQLDYRHFEQDEALADTFSMRRIRLGAGVTLFKDYSVYVEGDFASGGDATTQQQMRATLAYIDYTHWKQAHIRFGQFKPQIGLEQTLLDLQSDYMERGLQQNILDGNNINYDRGLMVYGAPARGTWYAVTYSNGTGQNLEEKQTTASDAINDSKDVTFRGVLDFAQILDVSDSILHVGVGYKVGEQANPSSTTTTGFVAPAARTEARGMTFFTALPFNAAGRTVSTIDREMVVGEMLLARGPVKLQGEYWTATYEGTRFAPGPEENFSRDIKAGYLSAMWLITGENYSDNYRDSIPQKIKPRNKFGWGEGEGWGAWEVGLRYSFFDASDFKTTNTVSTGQLAAGATNKAESYTAQLKWIHNIYTRAILDYVRTEFDTPVTVNTLNFEQEDAIMMRVQVDF